MSLDRITDGRMELPPNNMGLDEVAFEALFKEYYPRLCVYCKLKYGFDIALAEDVVNTGLVKLWEVRQTLSSDIAPKSYLYKIIDNSSLNILKHEKVKKQHAQFLRQTSSEELSPVGFDSVDLRELRAAINTAVSELPEQMRKVFELSRLEGLKYIQIAEELNISLKTVETQMGRALAKLREKLSGYSDGAYFILLILSHLVRK